MINPFVVTDENSINLYGFRVMTDGIDLTQFKRNPIMLYMHQRKQWNPSGDEVIGKWEAIAKKDGQLLMTPKFDEAEEFAKKIKGKVERNFIKMSSIGFRVIETSNDPKHMLQGQTRPTVMKCKLVEVSIVDVGANDNAMKLYAGDGEMIQLNDALPLLSEPKNENSKNKNNMNELKLIATSLGLKDDADLATILSAVGTLKQDVLDSETKFKNLEKEVTDTNQAEATSLMAKLKDAKLVDDAQLETYKSLFAADHANTKNVVEGMLAASKPSASSNKLDKFITGLGAEGDEDPKAEKLSFEKLSMEDPKRLAKIEKEQPELFEKLLAEYAGE